MRHGSSLTALSALSILLALATSHATVADDSSSSSSPPSQSAAGVLKVWTADPGYLTDFAAEANLSAFGVRLPQDYTADPPQHKPDGSVEYGWRGPARTVGVQAYVRVVVDVQDVADKKNTLAQSAALVMAAQKKILAAGTTGFKISPIQYGLVNGMPVARAYYKSEFTDGDSQRQFDAHGMVYFYRADPYKAVMVTMDTEPFTTDSLPELEASCQTMRPLKSGDSSQAGQSAASSQ